MKIFAGFLAATMLSAGAALAQTPHVIPHVWVLPPKPTDPTDIAANALWEAKTSPNIKHLPAAFTTKYHGLGLGGYPMIPAGFKAETSFNWAGVYKVESVPPQSSAAEQGTIPTLGLPSSVACNSDPLHLDAVFNVGWAGFDGKIDTNVVQGGWIAATACDGSPYLPAFFFEQFPNAAGFFSMQPAGLNDLQSVDVWHGSDGNDYFLATDFTTNQSQEIILGSSPYTGTSVEKIVEPPTMSNASGSEITISGTLQYTDSGTVGSFLRPSIVELASEYTNPPRVISAVQYMLDMYVTISY